MTGASGLQVSERRRGAGHGLGGTAGQGLVPLANGVGDERLEGEGLAVLAGAVAVAFPEAVDELGQGRSPFVAGPLRKESHGSFRMATIVAQGATLRKDHLGSLRSTGPSRPLGPRAPLSTARTVAGSAGEQVRQLAVGSE